MKPPPNRGGFLLLRRTFQAAQGGRGGAKPEPLVVTKMPNCL